MSFACTGISLSWWNSRSFSKLETNLPEEARKVTDWFRNNYVHGRIGRRYCFCQIGGLYVRAWKMDFHVPKQHESMAEKMVTCSTDCSRPCISNYRSSEWAVPYRKWCEHILWGEPCPKIKKKKEIFIKMQKFKILLMIIHVSTSVQLFIVCFNPCNTLLHM